MKYMISKTTENGKFQDQPTLGTFNKAFGNYQSDASARQYLAPLLEMKHFEAGRYAIYRGPSVSTDGVVVHTMTKVRPSTSALR